MHKLLLILFFFLSYPYCQILSKFQLESTSLPNSSRFEILGLNSSKFTMVFKLDKYNGNVFARNKNKWIQMEKINFPIISGSKARFQILATGNYFNDIILLDSQTGDTWYLEEGKNSELIKGTSGWLPFDKRETKE